MMKFILPAFLFLAVDAYSAVRYKCAPASSDVAEGTVLADYDPFFSMNRIIPQTNLSVNFVEQFKNEFSKFPFSLHQEMMAAGASIHIMEGEGVTVDPTWDATHVHTFDGRLWAEVPGAGGSTAKEYQKSPTRIVINHLYDKQGSASMFLHEYGHNLDSIHSYHGISNSQTWTDLLASEPNVMTFLSVVCGTYCTNNVEEGFAELLANYFGCEQTRVQMEQELPRIAEFFKRFKSTKNLSSIMNDNETAKPDGIVIPPEVADPDTQPAPEPEIESEQLPIPQYGPERRGPRLGCRRVFGREICI